MGVRHVFLLLMLGMVTGCSLTPLSHPTQREQRHKVEKLTQMLCEMNATVEPSEAKDMAEVAIAKAWELGEHYAIVSPPLWHNTLVNIGVKQRGLCYEWAEDLLRVLLEKRYTTLRFYAVGANIGNYFEHNAIVVAAQGEPYTQGILLDAWRDSGNLFFDTVMRDKKYEWKNRATLYRSIAWKLRYE